MPWWGWVLIAVAIVVLLALVVWSARSRSRSRALRERFGPEYDRAVTETGDRRAAESELDARRRRREELDIRPLDPTARERYTEQWRSTQSKFVDAPSEAIREADALVMQVMGERGYPMENFEQRAADISVDHPNLVENYRAAHAISLANDHGQASTEDMRQAMVHYRSLFEELLDTGGSFDREEAR